MSIQNDYLLTDEVAALFQVKENTVRTNVCLRNNFRGIEPLRADNGRLLFKKEDVEAVRARTIRGVTLPL